MKNFFKNLMPLLLLVAGLGISPNLWANDGGWNGEKAVSMGFQKNGESTSYYDYSNSKMDTYDLGIITSSFEIKGIYLKVWDDWGSNYKITGGQLCYKINNGSTQYIQTTTKTSKSGNNFELQYSGSKTIASSTDASGKYTMEHWFQAWGNEMSDIYWNGDGNNYTWNFTILPPAVSNFGVTSSGAVAGTGTSSDPFIMPYNGTLTLTVNSLSQAHTDANSSLSLTGTGSSKNPSQSGNVFTISSIQNYANANSVTITAKYHNSSANLDGAESTVTYYYKMGRTSLTLDKNNNDASGSNNGSSNVNLGSKSFSPTAPTRTGYEPDGYYLENGCTTYVAIASGSLKPSISNYTDGDSKWIYTGATATLYTKWKAKKYAISFDDQGATTAHTFTITEATYNELMPTFQSSKAPKKTGYTFQGYYTGTNGSGTKCYNADGTSAYTWILTPTETTTLYAYWAPNVNTIVFNANTGTGDQMTNQTFTYGQAAKALSKNTYTKTGYHFIGWARTANGEVEYTDEQEITNITENTENVNLYAKWEANVTNITLYRNYNNEDVTTYELSASYDCTIGQVTGLTSDIYTRTGYTHKGVFTARNEGSYLFKYDNGAAWKFNSTTQAGYCTATYWKYEAGGALNLYSQWTANKYTLTLSDNGGTGGSGTTQVTFDAKPASVNVPTKVVSEIAQIFTGYYYNDVQIFNNSGAIVLNAGGGIYTDNSGNWKYDGALTLTAKWEAPAKQKVYFGVTNSTSADETSGTVSAKIKNSETTVTSGDELDAGTIITISFSAKKGQYISNNGWKIASWWDGANTSTAQKLADAAGNSTSYDYTIPTKESSVYAYAPEVTNTFAIVVADGQSARGEVSPAQGTAGPNVKQQITATPNDGYDFVNWTQTSDKFVFVSPSTAESATAEVALKNEQNQTITANFAIHTYSITYNLDGGTNYNGAPEGYTIETATIVLGTPTKTDYTFDGWYDAETEGNKVTEIALGSTGDKTLWARWHETMHSVNIVESTGIESVSPSGATNVGNVTPVTITATVKAGYTWKNWTTDHLSRVTFGDINANPTTLKATESTNVYANATENMTAVTVSSNNTTWGTVNKNNVSVGISTSRQVTATPNAGYKFVSWTLDGGATSTSTLTNTTITINGDGSSATGTATANFEEDLTTGWRINLGYEGLEQWFTDDFVKKSGESTQSVGYVELNLPENYDYKFKVVKKGNSDTWYGNNNNEEAPKHWIKGNVSDWTFYSDAGDCYMQTTAAGTYTFKVDYSGENPKVSVTYPAAQTYTVTISADANGSVEPNGEQQVDAFNGISVTATPNPGYHFASWVKSEGITITSETATTTVKASQAGTLQATFAANTPIYFQNAIKNTWNPEHLYIYLYKDNTYWEGTGDDKQDRGTGSDKSKYDGSCIAGPIEMTHIQNTDIWEYDYDPALSFNTIVFTEQEMTNYEWFANCTAVRRTDFNSCMNMFVLNDATEEWHNNNTARYFNTGFWRNYNSTTSKMSLHVWDVSTSAEAAGSNVEMVSDVPGNETFTAKVKLDGNHQYNIYLGACNSKNFSQNVTITSENCSGIQMYQYNSIDDKTQLAYLHTAASGDYTFSLTFADDKMLLSVEYPITSNDYRVKIGTPARYSNIIRSSGASGTISMFLNAGTNTFTYEEATNVDVSPIEWGNEKQITVDNVEHAGVYTMTLTKGETPTITNIQPYTGNYYVRTDCAQGGWNEYKTNDNNLMRFTDRNPKYVNDSTTGFNYYYCRWNANENGNVRFVVANEINACISDTMKADEWLDNNEALKGMANIRFEWNSNTNALSRAYISGSYNEETYLQIHSTSEEHKLYEYAQNPNDTVIIVKTFKDDNDWTYVMDVYADGGSTVAVSAKYNNKYQFFVGEGSQENGTVTKSEQLLQGGTKQHMRVIYDFKTDRLVSGWVPGGNIESTVILNADMLLARIGQGNADQINITNVGAQIKEIKTIYAVLQLDREKMLSPTEGILAEDSLYTNAIYWFSLPFDVKVNDIFGVDGYGTKWVLQYYDGAKRAKIGFFAETETFWTYLGINDTIKANVGYAVCLDPDYFDSAEDEIWANNRQSVCFYFPSADKNLKIVGNSSVTISVPAHECKIDREFGDADEKGKRKNHKDTDSDWNVIGSPAFKNLTGTADMGGFQSLYEWQPTDNTYKVAKVENFTFQSTSAYLVQFHGEIKWAKASVITAAAPRYTYADEKNYTVELQFYYGSQWDRTYIALKDNAQEDFVLNEDLTKMTNSGQPNIYSFAGAYDVAYNGTAFKDQIVNLGVIARKNGSYTFAMPKDFSGSAILVDLESGEATDLNLSNYTVELNKGTYNNRFQLILKVEASTPTNIDNVDSREWSVDGKTKKLLINDQIYLINGGRVYNATGTEVR